MFSLLARLAVERPRTILGIAAVVFAVSVALGIPLLKDFAPPTQADTSAESYRVDSMLRKAFPEHAPGDIVILVGEKRKSAEKLVQPQDALVERVREVAARVDAIFGVRNVQSPIAKNGEVTFDGAGLISQDSRQALIIVGVSGSEHEHERIAAEVDEEFGGSTDVAVGGSLMFDRDINEILTRGLERALVITIPLLLLCTFWFFRSAVAALLPLVLAALGMLCTFFILGIVSQFIPVSKFSIDLTYALAMGLGFDYALLMVSRYRESMFAFGEGREAIAQTLNTAGRTVLFSSLTVSASLASLMVFEQVYLYSLGLAGAIVALVSCAASLVVLPALLFLFGTKINSIAPKRLQRSVQIESDPATHGRWGAIARFVMRRPWKIAITVSLVLLVIGLPFSRIVFTSADERVLPANSQSRIVAESIKNDFPHVGTQPIMVMISGSGKGSIAAKLQAKMREVRGVKDVVPFPRSPIAKYRDSLFVTVSTSYDTLSPRNQDVVRELRTLDHPVATKLHVGGTTAELVDQQVSLVDRLPWALAIIVIATFTSIFLMTGSFVLPLKSIIMNFLTLSATFGMLVYVFQDGHFSGVLNFTSQGALEFAQPLILCALVFGLSTDYGVFLLSRIQEAREYGASDDDAVAIGIERTGRIVTAAALLFCIAMSAMALHELVTVKQIGVGIAFAVMVDATVIRALLVPALMKLLGKNNWWAPKFVRKFRVASHH